MHILLSYDSLSQNTKTLGELIKDILEEEGHKVEMVFVHQARKDQELMNKILSKIYDLYIFGTWSYQRGRTPPKMKKYIIDMIEAYDEKPQNVASFGTGDKQFGIENFCGGAERIGHFFKTPYPILKIEQRHRRSEIPEIKEWVNIITNNKT